MLEVVHARLCKKCWRRVTGRQDEPNVQQRTTFCRLCKRYVAADTYFYRMEVYG